VSLVWQSKLQGMPLCSGCSPAGRASARATPTGAGLFACYACRCVCRITTCLGASQVLTCNLVQLSLTRLTVSHLSLCVQEDEMPSDFQDYSLVTLVGVAAHLMHVSGSTCCSFGATTKLFSRLVLYMLNPELVYLLAVILLLLDSHCASSRTCPYGLHAPLCNVQSSLFDRACPSLHGVCGVLPQAPLGESGGLDVLAARYGHDAKALDQVSGAMSHAAACNSSSTARNLLYSCKTEWCGMLRVSNSTACSCSICLRMHCCLATHAKCAEVFGQRISHLSTVTQVRTHPEHIHTSLTRHPCIHIPTTARRCSGTS
jgi:hypothetical protein